MDCAGYALFYPRLSSQLGACARSTCVAGVRPSGLRRVRFVLPAFIFAVWSVRPQHLQKQVCALVDFRYLLLFSRVGFPSSTFLSSRTNNTPPPRSGRHASPKAHFTTKVGTPRVPAHACYNQANLRTPKRLCIALAGLVIQVLTFLKK